MSSRKILVMLSDVPDEAQHTLSFAFQLLKNNKSLVVAAYLHHSKGSFDIQSRVVQTARLQNDFGNHPNIRLALRTINGLTPAELEREARYTDLIVLGAELLNQAHGSTSIQLLSGINSNLQVPVLVVPGNAHTTDEIIITYDGLPEGLATIKQFCQILDNFCQHAKVTLVEFNHNCNQYQPEEEKLLVEYLKQHCSNLGIYKVSDESPQKVLQMINSSGNAIVVSGTLRMLGEKSTLTAQMVNPFTAEEKLPGFFGAV